MNLIKRKFQKISKSKSKKNVNNILVTKRNKEVVLCLVQINIHTYIYQIYMCLDIIYLFETIVSKAWPSSLVFFKIINIIFHAVSIVDIEEFICF